MKMDVIDDCPYTVLGEVPVLAGDSRSLWRQLQAILKLEVTSGFFFPTQASANDAGCRRIIGKGARSWRTNDVKMREWLKQRGRKPVGARNKFWASSKSMPRTPRLCMCGTKSCTLVVLERSKQRRPNGLRKIRPKVATEKKYAL